MRSSGSESAASVFSGNTPPTIRQLGRASQHFARRSNSLDGRRTAMSTSTIALRAAVVIVICLWRRKLIASPPDVIWATGTPITAALQRETRAIPIVFTSVSDPIGAGFVASLARPRGNITGVLLYETGIIGKWLAMLKE